MAKAVTLVITDDDLLQGWYGGTCPVHRAVARAFGIDAKWCLASMHGIGYIMGESEHYTQLDFKDTDWNYLLSVMAYADAMQDAYRRVSRPLASAVLGTIRE